MTAGARAPILVTGASGSLGRVVASYLAASGRDVIAQHFTHRCHLPGTPSVALDLADRAKTREALDSLRPRAIVHTAAATDVDWCEAHPEDARRSNVDATTALAQWCSDHDAPLIYTSTDLVFDGNAPPYDESASTNPLSHYARTKEEGERAVRALGVRGLVLRVALLYGRGSAHKGTFFDFMLGRLARGERVTLFADQFRTPVLLGDVARLIACALDRGAHGLYHVGGPDRLSRFAFGEAVARVYGFSSDLLEPSSFRAHAFQGSRPADVSLDSRRVARELGISFLAIADGLAAVRAEAAPPFADA